MRKDEINFEPKRFTPKTKSPEQALNSLMALCAKAERSSGDAMRLMSRWGVDKERRAEVLQRLLELKFIDDRRYAEAYIREKMNLSGWGIRKIAYQLRTKGVSPQIIEELTSDVDKEQLSERLVERLKRKLRSVKYETKYELKTKLIRFGASLGYDYEDVAQGVDVVLKDLE